MHTSIALAPVPDIPVFRTSARRPDESEAIRRRAADGELTRIGRGRFVPTESWRALRPAERHLVRVYAVTDRIRPDRLVSHVSAAVVLGAPVVSAPPDRVHVLVPGADRRTTDATFVVHADLDPSDRSWIRTPSGLGTTSATRTAVDVAMTMPLVDTVVVLDDLLARGADRDDVRAAVGRRGRKGRRRALHALELADPASGSVGESIARVRFDEYGAPTPVLQHRFRQIGHPDIVVDFWFPDAEVVVEFDGDVKYTDASMRGGRSPHEVLVDEKRREDRLRAFPGVRTVVRITWADLWDEQALRAKLRAAGVRLAR